MLTCPCFTSFIPYEIPEIRAASIYELAKLSKSDRLRNVMQKIEELQNNPTKNSIHTGDSPVEADPEYILIVEANNLAVGIDDEICQFSSM